MIGFLREVSPNLEKCELTHMARRPIDGARAIEQHRGYAKALEDLGVQIERVPALPEQADGVFVEDVAVLLPEVAVIARPGAQSRLPEISSTTQALGQHRPVQSIVEPATLDGGDVLRIGRVLYVAESSRTNAEGLAQLRGIVQPFGYEMRVVQVRDCLHLKSACTFIPPRHLLVNPAWIDTTGFQNLVVISVDEKEPFAANTLTIGRTTLVSASFPKTEKRLREAGLTTRRVDVSEFEKAEGGLTCLSLILEPRSTKSDARENTITPILAGGVPKPAGHVSSAIAHQGVIYVSPQMPFDPTAARRRRASAAEQVEHAIGNLSAVLAAAGSSLDCVLRATVHVAEAKYAAQIEEAYARSFGRHRPARAVIVNGALPTGVSVAIEAVAAVNPAAG
jgi:dimethylargininase